MEHKLKKLIAVAMAITFLGQTLLWAQTGDFCSLRALAYGERNPNGVIEKIAIRITQKITEFIRREQLTSGDLNNIIWALMSEEMPRDQNGNYRQFTDEEIFEILAAIEKRLLEIGFVADETPEYSAPKPIEEFRGLLIDQRRPLSLILPSLDRLINNLPALLKAANIRPDEFPVFLARDALTAGEFLRYCSVITGREAGFASVYQPGMSRTAIVSDFVHDSAIDMVQKATDLAKAHVIERLRKERKIPAKASDPFYNNFHPEIYAELENYFMEDMIKQWQEAPALLKEAEILFQQMVRNGVTGHKNIVIMDMAVTGKTVLYIKTVLKYFCEKNNIDIGTIRIFVGYSHDKKMCLPEVRLFDPTFDASGRPFKDQVWPFYRAARNGDLNETSFKFHQKRFEMLVHVYRSLRLYNAALRYTKVIIEDKTEVVMLNTMRPFDAFMDQILRAQAFFEREAKRLQEWIAIRINIGMYREAIAGAQKLRQFNETAAQDFIRKAILLRQETEPVAIAVRSMSHSAGTDAISVINGAAYILQAGVKQHADNAQLLDCAAIVEGAKEKILDLHQQVKERTLDRSPTKAEAKKWQRDLRAILKEIKILHQNVLKVPTNILAPHLKELIIKRLINAVAILENRIRFAAGRPNRKKCDIFSLIERGCKPSVGYEGEPIQSVVDIAPIDSFPVYVDEITMVNAIGNIVDNAVEIIKDGDRVLVTIEKRDDHAVICVKNRGPKIPLKFLVKDEEGVPLICCLNVSTKGPGRGLGLAEAWQAIRYHGGTLDIKSDGEWDVIFEISLPLGKAAVTAESRAVKPSQQLDNISIPNEDIKGILGSI